MNNPKTFIEPIAGYIVDLTYKIFNKPFIPHSLTKLHNLKLCRDITGASTVIEIGSFWGSDIKKTFLKKKLGLLNFTPEPRGKAVQSIFKMSNSNILVGLRSTFLFWTKFIGNSYTIWPKDFE